MYQKWTCCCTATLPFLSDFSTDESAVLLTDVAHVPQTAASHRRQPAKQQSPRADVHREDPRDSLHRGARQFHMRQRMRLTHSIFSSSKLHVIWNCGLSAVPLIESSLLRGVLPDCLYKPTYTIKDFPLQRYQGLQFVCIDFVHFFFNFACFEHKLYLFSHVLSVWGT